MVSGIANQTLLRTIGLAPDSVAFLIVFVAVFGVLAVCGVVACRQIIRIRQILERAERDE